MISGMTGFGSVEKACGKIKFTIEIKSQNHRYLDLVFFLPAGFSAIESKMRDRINKEIQRGRVTVALKITDKSAQHLVYNREIVKEYLRYAAEMKKEFGLVNNFGVADIFRLPGIFEARETNVNSEELWPAIQSAFSQSLRGLLMMRRRERRALGVDLRKLLQRMTLQIKKIEMRSKALLLEKNKSATTEEFVSYQKSCDINEENTRMIHYIDEARALLSATAVVGKKLDFVAQEMQRETNTIGSKVQDQIVSNAVIALKSKIEKLREQAQNVE